ncbi:MAG: TIM barrel protein [Sporichthyaceae bacterium]
MNGPWTQRLAGAPISWGVCEVPGWGHQLPVDLVLVEMAQLGLQAAEFGPDGFLPDDGPGRATALATHGLRAVGGFVPVLVHRAEVDPLESLDALLDTFVGAEAEVVVFAAVSGADGYDARPVLDEADWSRLCANLDRLDVAVQARGLIAALHPHIGTVVERPDEVDRVLAGSGIGLCLDTGHLLAGGTDPYELTLRAGGRIVHVHLKDVNSALAAQVRDGSLSYHGAVAGGMYVPLGAGDARIADVVTALETSGYAGWYVLEQDCVLASPPGDAGSADAQAAAVIRADVEASLAHLRAAVPVPA